MAVNQLKAGAVLSLLSFGVANVLGLFYTPFMLRMMGQEEYGLYSLVASIVSYLTMLDFGFGNAIVRYTSQYRAIGRISELPYMFGMFFMLYTIVGLLALTLGLILFFNIDWLFGRTMDEIELKKIRAMMLLLLFNVVFTFAMSVWRSIPLAYEKFIFSKAVNLARMLLNPLVMVVLLVMGYKAVALVVVTTVFNVMTLCTDYWYCKKKLHVRLSIGRFSWGNIRKVVSYSFWIFVGVVVERIYWSSGQFMLGMFVGSSEVAVYAVSVQFAYVFMGLGSFLWSMYLPKVSRLTSTYDNVAVSDLFVRICRMQYIILLFVFVLFVIFGKAFIAFWAGPAYVHAYPITLMFFASLLFPYAQNMGAVVAQAKGLVKSYAIIRLLTSVVGLVISAILIRLYGDIGCAIGIVFALFLQTVILNIYYHRTLNIDIPRFWCEIFKPSIFPVIVCIGGWYFLHRIQWHNFSFLILNIICFSILFALLCWFLSLNSYERNLLIQPLRKFRMKQVDKNKC